MVKVVAELDLALQQSLAGNLYDVSRPGGEHKSVSRGQLLFRGSECWPGVSTSSRDFQKFFKWKKEICIII